MSKPERGPEPASELPFHMSDVTRVVTMDGELIAETAEYLDAATIVHRVNNWGALWEHCAELEAEEGRLRAELDTRCGGSWDE